MNISQVTGGYELQGCCKVLKVGGPSGSVEFQTKRSGSQIRWPKAMDPVLTAYLWIREGVTTISFALLLCDIKCHNSLKYSF